MVKGFRKINELVAALAEAERSMRDGVLGLEGLDAACTNARELYERLVVLRHKAREAALSRGGQEAAAPPLDEADALPDKAPASIRLDTRPGDIGSRQTSLIDAIDATEQSPDEPPRPKVGTSARKKSTNAGELAKTISLDRKFWFVAELFNGDRTAYEKAIEALDGLADLDAAEAFVAEKVTAKLKKAADPEALSAFKELLQRRFA